MSVPTRLTTIAVVIVLFTPAFVGVGAAQTASPDTSDCPPVSDAVFDDSVERSDVESCWEDAYKDYYRSRVDIIDDRATELQNSGYGPVRAAGEKLQALADSLYEKLEDY